MYDDNGDARYHGLVASSSRSSRPADWLQRQEKQHRPGPLIDPLMDEPRYRDGAITDSQFDGGAIN